MSLVIREGQEESTHTSREQSKKIKFKSPKGTKKKKTMVFKKEVSNGNSFSFFQLKLNCILIKIINLNNLIFIST